MNLIERTIAAATGTNAAELRADGFCFKCLKEAGVQADEILAMPIELDAVELRRAGFSLRDLLGARNRNNRRVHHPPVTKYTLFDSQLQSAGFSAGEFRAAGYRAEQLSYAFFWKELERDIGPEEHIDPGDAQWEETYAFFNASDLRSAGYDASELENAGFSVRELENAGFSVLELQNAGLLEIPAKARPTTKSKPNTKASGTQPDLQRNQGQPVDEKDAKRSKFSR